MDVNDSQQNTPDNDKQAGSPPPEGPDTGPQAPPPAAEAPTEPVADAGERAAPRRLLPRARTG